MNPIIIYLLKSALSLALFYIFYWSFLKKETFFRFNRYYFLGSITLSLLIPIIDIGSLFIISESIPVRTISESYVSFQNAVVSPLVIAQPEIANKLNITDYVLIIYFIGAAFILLRMLTQAITLLVRSRKTNALKIAGLKVIPHKKIQSPFSFFSFVFINPEQLDAENIREVILHEKEHIRQKHSFDLLIIELLTVLQWPNPFVWLTKKSLKETHEFLADHAVLKQGVPKDNYQKTLISFMLGAGNPALITPLNFSLNKKRIIMMNKMKSPNIRKWRSLLLLPLIVLLTLAFSSPLTTNKDTKTNSDQTIQPATNKSEVLNENKYMIKGTVTDSETGKPIVGVSVLDRDKMTGTITDSHGCYTLQIDLKRTSVVFIADGYKMHIKGATEGEDVKVELTKKDDSEKPVLVLLYGREITLLESMNIPAGTIKKFEKIEGEDAIKEYGKKGRNGVANIILKEDCIQLKDIDLSKPIPRRIIIDGKEITKAEFLELPSKRNYKFEEINGDDAVRKYGESARFGIFVGIRISGSEKHAFSGKVVDKETNEPLPGASIILPGKHIGTISDSEGRFKIVTDSETAQLSFSYLNYETVTVTLKSGNDIIINLQKVVEKEYTVSGTGVNDETGKPMPGVSIVVYGTTTGTITDIDGKFLLKVAKDNAKIIFSFVGYESVITDLKDGDNLKIRMKKEIVVISFDNLPESKDEAQQPRESIKIDNSKPVFFVVEDMPEYPGGVNALNDYITSNTNYPKKAKKQNITGTVYVNFTIDKSGSVTDVYIDKNKTVNPLLDKEAGRVVSEMPKWKPGMQRGKKVPVSMSVPVAFKLN